METGILWWCTEYEYVWQGKARKRAKVLGNSKLNHKRGC